MKIKLTPNGAEKLIGKKYAEWRLAYSRLDFAEAKLLSKGKDPNSYCSIILKRKEVECREAALDDGYRVKVEYEDLGIIAIFGCWYIDQEDVDLDKLNAKIGSYNYSVEDQV